jgi:site-specific DNA-methyltransferase (cytosine-N4-specific)
LLESAHSGWNAVGIDRNPLAVHIANAKLNAFRRAVHHKEFAVAVVDVLRTRFSSLFGARRTTSGQLTRLLGENWQRTLPCFSYLSDWFPAPVLGQIAAIRRTIEAVVPATEDRAVLDVVLSDQLRAVSLQEPLDLRVRRRKDPAENYPLLDLFVDAVLERLERVVRARAVFTKVRGRQLAILGDSRLAARGHGGPRHGFDAVITSPPYETALPYIDTQRLSLVLFGHVDAAGLQTTEKELIGAREISTTERRQLEDDIGGRNGLPHEITDLCRELLAAASRQGNGFRRRNRPALLYRYFRNMAAFFANLRSTMRPGARVALVVGTNRTTLSGREYVIDTPRLLTLVGRHAGFDQATEYPMDTYQRYDLHQRNSIDREVLLVLTAP